MLNILFDNIERNLNICPSLLSQKITLKFSKILIISININIHKKNIGTNQKISLCTNQTNFNQEITKIISKIKLIFNTFFIIHSDHILELTIHFFLALKNQVRKSNNSKNKYIHKSILITFNQNIGNEITHPPIIVQVSGLCTACVIDIFFNYKI